MLSTLAVTVVRRYSSTTVCAEPAGSLSTTRMRTLSNATPSPWRARYRVASAPRRGRSTARGPGRWKVRTPMVTRRPCCSCCTSQPSRTVRSAPKPSRSADPDDTVGTAKRSRPGRIRTSKGVGLWPTAPRWPWVADDLRCSSAPTPVDPAMSRKGRPVGRLLLRPRVTTTFGSSPENVSSRRSRRLWPLTHYWPSTFTYFISTCRNRFCA